jgi:glucosamine--fructose-6-phosphate aminotransferase (isomerizing)
MKKYGVSEPPKEGEIPSWLKEEVQQTPLWYIIRESEEVRNEHPFILIEEVYKEPEQFRDILANYAEQTRRVAAHLHENGIKEVIFTGCGSAFFTAMHGEFVFEQLTGIRTRAVESFELTHYFPNVDPASSVVIAHSGTGGSIETREAVEEANKRGVYTIAATNTVGSPLQQLAKDSLYYETEQRCGPCINVISTRVLLITMLGIELGLLKEPGSRRLKELKRQLQHIPDIAQTFIDEQEDNVRTLAEKYKDISSFFLVGTGPNYFSAREGTLKIEEESICVSKAYRPGDYLHDVISILHPTNCTIAIAGNEKTNYRIADCLDTAEAAESNTIAVVFGDNDEIQSHAGDTIRFQGGLDEILTPIPLTLLFHMFGYYRGVARGYNPDTLRTDHWPNAKAWITAFPIGTH